MSKLIGIKKGEAPFFRIIEPNVVSINTSSESITLIFRYLSPSLQYYLLSGSRKRIWMFMDDNLDAIDQRNGLPSDYVTKLRFYRENTFKPIIRKSERLITSSSQLARSNQSIAVSIVNPALIYELPTLEHHSRSKFEPFKLVFPGSRAHLDGLASIAGVLTGLLRRNRHWHLTTFLGNFVPSSLKLPNTSHLKPMAWLQYQKFVGRNRFHVALCPMVPSDFNQSRSQTKLLDVAAFGAAGLYARVPPYSNWFRQSTRAGELVGTGGWAEALLALDREPVLAYNLALGGQELAKKIGDNQAVKEKWLSLIDL